jgi:hypothetical protein
MVQARGQTVRPRSAGSTGQAASDDHYLIRDLETAALVGSHGHNPIQVDKSIEKNQMARGLFQSPKVNFGPARFATGEIARSRGRKFFPPA